ncbi:hypothetical protein BAE44_0007781 [Dichanthelium oligosanthes]|uniref:Uncharacterized protein n=1 Tax=Dichanthelium oligosanthes TaxID=888268 RepID=A0A1E5W1R7_9POAL|nr:hypothetical protein BAE44_0007781 [Dichanthelium oligosanthes]
MADRARAEAAAAVPAGDRELLRNIFLDAGRVLMLLGAAAFVGSSSTDSTQVLVGLVLWLLGVCLLALSLVPGRFPRAALVAAAIAIAILKHLFILWN